MGKSLTIEAMQELAHAKNGECLSSRYVNAVTKLRWRCAKGHEWEAQPSMVKNEGTWCPFCSGKLKHTIEVMKEIATQRGGECLSNHIMLRMVKVGVQFVPKELNHLDVDAACASTATAIQRTAALGAID